PILTCALRSRSNDFTARIWSLGSDPHQLEGTPILLNHASTSEQDLHYVTTLDWDPSGNYLATGSFDGHCRIWTLQGDLRYTLQAGKGPVLALKWGPRGKSLVGTSADAGVKLWDSLTGELRAEYLDHQGAVLDVHWITAGMFATCSNDTKILIYSSDQSAPLHSLVGHTGGVHAVRSDPTGRYLASASEDHTARIWSLADGQTQAILTGHSQDVYALEWCPVAKLSDSVPSLLATCSSDHTVRVWDATAAACLFVLDRCAEPVLGLSFSPNGQYLATGSLDHSVHVWSTTSGQLVKQYDYPSSVLGLQWSPTGDYIACCLVDTTTSILDGHMKPVGT
ncbi:WD40-repeat-containing domain protein, partial [Dimargaris cristalligena]